MREAICFVNCCSISIKVSNRGQVMLCNEVKTWKGMRFVDLDISQYGKSTWKDV